MSEEKERIRTVTWEDPMVIVEGGKGLSGIEWLRAVQAGELPMPPIAALLGMDLEEVEEGLVVFSLKLEEFHYNPYATVHGGVTTTLLDSAMTCAVQSALPRGTLSTTLDLTTHFLRPMTVKTGKVLCEAKTIHVGGRVATAEGRVMDEMGKIYAHATTTCMVIRP